MLRKTTVLLSLGAALLGATATAQQQTDPANAADADVTEPEVVPGAYIVELEDGQDASGFLGSVSEEATARARFASDIFNGVSIQMTNATGAGEHAATIAGLRAVRKMWPVVKYPMPDFNRQRNVSLAAAPGLDRRSAADTFTPHVMTQVDLLRRDGVTGEGLKIGVIDTGIDYLHPAFGGCFGPGCVVTHGWDFVGDDFDGDEGTERPGPEVMDCAGHGTHVAGIVAAQENDMGFTGAAPGVRLGAYKVFGCGGATTNEVLIAAFLRAYADGNDIITASIGRASGWSEDPWAVVVSRIVARGVPCTLAAGNSGGGVFTPSSAANGKGVTAVGSVDNVVSPSYVINSTSSVDGAAPEPFRWTPGDGSTWPAGPVPLVFATRGTGCFGRSDWPIADLSLHIPVVRRGAGCSFIDIARHVMALGARNLLVVNNVAGSDAAGDVGSVVPGFEGVGIVAGAEGEAWIAALAAGAEVTVDLSNAGDDLLTFWAPDNTLTGGFPSGFSSWGPTADLDVKPQFTAPGGRILSTVPRAQGLYAVQSGTSMAAPLAAAVLALVGSVRGTTDPAELESVLSATANPNLWNDGAAVSSVLGPVPQQGGGMIQAYAAAHATTILSKSSIAFNDTKHLVPTQAFTIRNTAAEAVTYQLSHVPAATVLWLDRVLLLPNGYPNQQVPQQASLSFSRSTVTVPAGGTAEVEVTVTPPSGFDAASLRRVPVYSGYIALNATSGEAVSLPYQGVAASMYDVRMLYSSWLEPGPDQTYSYTLPRPGTAEPTDPRVPLFRYQLPGGTRLLRALVVPTDREACAAAPEAFGYCSIGEVAGFPAEYVSPSWPGTWWDGALNDGTYAPAGEYRLVIMALKFFGDVEKVGDYNVRELGPLVIRYGGGCSRRTLARK